MSKRAGTRKHGDLIFGIACISFFFNFSFDMHKHSGSAIMMCDFILLHIQVD